MACILYTRGRMSRKSLSETLYRSRAIRARAFIGVNTYVRYVSIIASVNRRVFPPSFVRPLRSISTSADRHGGLRMNESRFSRERDLQYRVSPLSVYGIRDSNVEVENENRLERIISESQIFDEKTESYSLTSLCS